MYLSQSDKEKFCTNLPWHAFREDGKDECWPWMGGTHERGYGLIHIRRKTYRAHRISYEIFNSPIPKGMVVMHTCDNTNCVNPRHLILGTQADNVLDCVQKERHQKSTKLNSEAIKVIKWMLKYKPERGLAAKLARLHKVDPDTISQIKREVNWKHIIV